MSLAWGGLVILVLLLPGFLFFVGLYLPERFTRETSERNPLSQLAGVVLTSIVIHGSLYLVVHALCTANFPKLDIPCVRIDHVLSAVSLESGDTDAITKLSDNLRHYRYHILGYVLLACTMGMLIGFATGTLVVRGPLRRLAQHTWIYDLSIEDAKKQAVTLAYVMSDVQFEERIILYRGFLKAFGLQRDGKFSYLVLTSAVRYYMHLRGDRPETAPRELWRQIGYDNLPTADRTGPEFPSYLVLEGNHVANVVFDRYEIMERIPSDEELKRRIQESKDKFNE